MEAAIHKDGMVDMQAAIERLETFLHLESKHSIYELAGLLVPCVPNA